jgi:hypothetical protein
VAMLGKHYCQLIILCMSGMSLTVEATSVTNQPRPVVIELFTSQGCSSCPPADALLGEVASNPDVIALAYHVDYWDYIGWKDPFALPQSTQRQRNYAQSLQLSSVFTPQAIIDGQSSIVGSSRRSLINETSIKRTGLPIDTSVNKDTLTISLGERTDHVRLDVMLVAYQSTASTSVGRGENSGHTLKEFNIVRYFRQVDLWDGKAHKFDIAISTLPVEANRIAVLIQQPNQGPIVAAKQISLR